MRRAPEGRLSGLGEQLWQGRMCLGEKVKQPTRGVAGRSHGAPVAEGPVEAGAGIRGEAVCSRARKQLPLAKLESDLIVFVS